MTGFDHVVCSRCGSVNRLPKSRRAEGPRCGNCHEPLFSGHPRDVDGSTFERQLARNSLPLLVDVWAPWCGPCRMMAPAYEAAARQLEPRVQLVKLNSDVEQQLAGGLGIRGIPTLILFHAGKEVARTSGLLTAAQIVRWVQERLPRASP